MMSEESERMYLQELTEERNLGEVVKCNFKRRDQFSRNLKELKEQL